MARVKIEAVIEALDYEMKRALERAVHETLPDVEFNRLVLYKNFVRAVRVKCSTWEKVPDSAVET